MTKQERISCYDAPYPEGSTLLSENHSPHGQVLLFKMPDGSLLVRLGGDAATEGAAPCTGMRHVPLHDVSAPEPCDTCDMVAEYMLCTANLLEDYDCHSTAGHLRDLQYCLRMHRHGPRVESTS